MSILALDNQIIKGATIVASAAGNTILVPAVTGKMIALLQCILSSDGSVNVRFQSGPGTTDLTGPIYLVAGSDFEFSPSKIAWCLTAPGQALSITLSGAVNVGGVLSYVEVS